MARKRPTIADIRANKGKVQYTMMRTESWDELAAAEAAGIDMVSVPPEMMIEPRFRDVGPSLFAVPGMNYFEGGNTDFFIDWSFKMLKAGADAVYCSASLQTVKRLAEEAVPVIGHVGLIPSKATWTGGFKAVGKTAASAKQVFEQVKRYEEAGAFGVEIEVVPPEVTAEISKHTDLFLVSMGGGSGGDCQYLFGCDVLGTNSGHVPRHAKKYANLAAEYARIQTMRVDAFKSFVAEVQSGGWPTPEYLVTAPKAEMDAFKKMLAGK
ncbi:3-methyl-2-oxobutanoate hydroxymethyltransferase [Aestuariivirga litoralis]|uniref:3-methyl-2-oxobutanoate hydroxymethyltransferase n=1 Tax=Aestuariivirga litoralis TaxID=2650924 RepID=UPI0018C6693B|nr:3-methyl-2-oxobutanoate hydroxymethyltransferase [Aestuariivirga litoralis]MBG1230722.1 3-methyl-2-oxobutanoate hydroxymethyltransferase [Aestuariivirga litoralis]